MPTAEIISQIPHLSEYCGIWCCHEPVFNLLARKVESMDLGAHLETVAALRSNVEPQGYQTEITEDGVGILHIQGLLTKHVSSLSSGTSTVLARRSLRQLVANESVKQILLRIESPGGTAAGTAELAHDITRANATKPVTAFIEDLGASAAYWTASAAGTIYANAAAKVGSIGTYNVVADYSAAAAKEGVKIHVVKAGLHKGAGIQGTEVTPEQLAEIQKIVDGVNDFFVAGVAEGRKLTEERVRELADGRIHLAADAQELGLIDGIKSFEEVLEMLSTAANSNSRSNPTVSAAQNRSTRMSENTNTEPVAASVKEIKAAFEGISAEKVLEFAEANLTLEQCKDQYLADLISQNKSLSEKVTELEVKVVEAEKTKAALGSIGVDGLEHTASSKKGAKAEGSATEEFWALVAEKTDSGIDRSKAIKAVDKENPGLRQAMLKEANG